MSKLKPLKEWAYDDRSGVYRQGNLAVRDLGDRFNIYRDDCFIPGDFASAESAIAAFKADDIKLSDLVVRNAGDPVSLDQLMQI